MTRFNSTVLQLLVYNYHMLYWFFKGELSTKRALRKCQQIENLLYSVKYVSSDNDVIVDFCCGGVRSCELWGNIYISELYTTSQPHMTVTDCLGPCWDCNCLFASQVSCRFDRQQRRIIGPGSQKNKDYRVTKHYNLPKQSRKLQVRWNMIPQLTFHQTLHLHLLTCRGVFNVGVALHACGVATDMVLRHCMEANSSFVISPCCYGRIKNTHSITYPQR